eukprot:307600_1
MSVLGKDARCVVTKANVNDMVKKVNGNREFDVNGIPIKFAISDQGSRCLREYVDLILMDVTNKYVNVIRHGMNTNRNNNMDINECKQREKLMLGSVLRQTKHLITNKQKKKQIHECFIEKTNDKSHTLNPIFLKSNTI